MDWLSKHLDKQIVHISGVSITLFSIIIFFCIFLASIFLGRLARIVSTRFVVHRGGPQSAGLGYAIGRVMQYVVVLIGLMVGFDNVGLSLRALAAAGALISVGLAFGIQNIVQNFVSGLILLIERPVQKGDFIVVGETVGTVDEIAMRATRVISRDGVAIIVPNSELITGRVDNLSAPTAIHRLRIPVGVAYGSDTAKVRDALLEVAEKSNHVLPKPPPRVLFRSFGDSSLDFELAVWLDDPAFDVDVQSDMLFAIDAIFRERSIEIPFPQRDLHIRSGLEPLTPLRPAHRTSQEEAA